MKDVVHIIGHKNPDTDSIISSIAYAELKRLLGVNAIACRIGDINTETAFVLKKFQVSEPVYIQNARVKLYDVMFDEPLMVKEDCTLREAWKLISGTKTSSLYVVNEQEHLLGVVSMSDIMNILMNERGQNNNAHLMQKATIENISKVLDGEFVYQAATFHSTGYVYFVISRKAKYSEVNFQDTIAVLSDDVELQKKVILEGASCIVLVDVEEVSQDVIALAKEHACSIIKTPQDLLKVARSIYKAPTVGDIMKKEIISFHNHAYIDDVYHKMSKSRYRSYPVLNKSGKVLGSISRYHLLNYKKKKFILLDHNETSQSIDYLEDGEILEIIDHHRIGDVETTYPIRFRNELVGSTCTIISLIYREHQIVPTPTIAGMLCCAIISDTMNFNSPTTTAIDKEMATSLAKIANLDLDATAKEMFGAVATLKGRSLSEILYNDFKEYNIDGKRIAIGQINLADVEEMEQMKEEFITYMKKINEMNKFDLLMMCFTNVEGKGSHLVFVGELSWIVDEVFKEDILDEHYFVDGIISRKKQIIPRLSRGLNM